MQMVSLYVFRQTVDQLEIQPLPVAIIVECLSKNVEFPYQPTITV